MSLSKDKCVGTDRMRRRSAVDVTAQGPLNTTQARLLPRNLLASQNSELYWNATSTYDDVIHYVRPGEASHEPTQVADPDVKVVTPTRACTTSIRSPLAQRTDSGSSTSSSVTAVSIGKRSCSDADEQQPHRNVRPKQSDDPQDPFYIHGPVAEGPVIIAYDRSFQAYLSKLPTGVQWEVARLVSLGSLKYSHIVLDTLLKLNGSNAETAPKVASTLLPKDEQRTDDLERAFERERSAKSPWAELDREEDALRKDGTAGLGCTHGDDWYGGKVHFSGKLVVHRSGKHAFPFRIELERAELGPSSRFFRRFGSAAFLKIGLPKDVPRDLLEQLEEYFLRPFILNGAIYRAFYSKKGNVEMVQTNERIGNEDGKVYPTDATSRTDRLSLMDFLNWHNPMTANYKQPIGKWVDRFALGLSNSVPGIRLDPAKVVRICDEVSTAHKGDGKPANEHIMTDGCGFASAPLLRSLREKFQWETFPNAIQVRVKGAKGLLLLDPVGRYDERQTELAIQIRDSQVKINYELGPGEEWDPALTTLDVLRNSSMKCPASISHEVIINLAENKVPHSQFINLMKAGLHELAEGLLTWSGPNAMRRLWDNVNRVGRVTSMRMAREIGGESRVRGLGDRDDAQQEAEEDDPLFDKAVDERPTAWWADEVSGCPATLDETVMSLLECGFTPTTCPVLADKLKNLLKTAVNRFVERYKITIPGSAIGFIVPDPFGVLQPGEIHVKLSRQVKGRDEQDTDVVHGDVLVTRYPCKVPTDVQKVRAVHSEKLRQYTDVIVFNITDHRSLASMLGGGDYDGDKAIVIWQREIVDSFKNAPAHFADPPKGIKDAFVINKETVSEFLTRCPSTDILTQQRELQKYLLVGLRHQYHESLYSVMHDNAVYEHGYSSEEAKRLAYMFCACLDGSKNGLLGVKKNIFDADRKKYGHPRGPLWRETEDDRIRLERRESNDIPLRRRLDFKFIMDSIKDAGERERDIILARFKEGMKDMDYGRDEHLAAPWRQAWERAERYAKEMKSESMLDELRLIKEHVRQMRIKRSESVNQPPANGPGARARQAPTSPSKHSFTSLRIELRQDRLRALSREFASQPCAETLLHFDEGKVRELRASYAYVHDWEMSQRFSDPQKKWSRFPWDVAMRDLCEIKLKALGQFKPIHSEFYNGMTLCSYARAPR